MKEFFRNVVDLDLDENNIIEVGSLFEKIGDKMRLVDDDTFVEIDYDKDLFEFAFNEEIENNE